MMKKMRLSLIFALMTAVLLAACAPAAATAEPTQAVTAEPTVEITAEPTDAATAEPTAEATSESTAEATAESTAEGTGEAFNVTATDALGNEITLTAKPQKIVSLTLGTDEILLEMVGPERLIGVTYLASDKTTSNIADNPALDLVANVVEANPEQIIALEPDLVFAASFIDQAVLDQLTGAGVKVYAIGSFTSIEAMQQNILDIGRLVGEEETAQGMVETMNDRLAAVTGTLIGVEGEPPTVLYLASGGWVAGSATTVDDIITRAGGINAAAEEGLEDWNQINEEAIIQMDPDVVILSPYVKRDEFKENPGFSGLSALANGRVYILSDACMSATSQYIVCGVEEVARVLFPDLFKD
jgi:iron complex transport system substrate-binding protein